MKYHLIDLHQKKKMKKKILTEKDIEYILDFIKPNPNIPEESGKSLVEINKNRIRKHLVVKQLYPKLINDLKKEIMKNYFQSQIQPGESVGIICAQSIGERQTQNTLNSLDWTIPILYADSEGVIHVEPIGKMIDEMLLQHRESIQYYEENKTEYLSFHEKYSLIPSCDEFGKVAWYKIEGVTKHLPNGKLIHVRTKSGRSILASQSKSFIVWDHKTETFQPIDGSELKIGHLLPLTRCLQMIQKNEIFDIETFFSKKEYLFTDEMIKARRFLESDKTEWCRMNGVEFTLPYDDPTLFTGRKKQFFQYCEGGFIYLPRSNVFISKIRSQLQLDADFGFFVGVFMSRGCLDVNHIILLDCMPIIQDRIFSWCDRYSLIRLNKKTDIHISSKLMQVLMKTLTNHMKEIPVFIFTSNESFLRGFIDGIISTNQLSKDNDEILVIKNRSEMILHGIGVVFSFFGIVGEIQKNNKNLHISISEIRKTFTKITKVFAVASTNKRVSMNRHHDIVHDEVITIDFVDGKTPFVYDLTVEKTRNFNIFNGICVRDSFHKAGQNEKTVTTGVPRFLELINATKSPKIVNSKIFFTESNSSIESLRNYVNHQFVSLTLKDLALTIDISMSKIDEPWYEFFKILYNENFTKFRDCLSIQVNSKILYKYRIKLADIARVLEERYDDLFCVFSSDNIGRLDVFVDMKNIKFTQKQLLYVTPENAHEIYMDECVLSNLEKMVLFGIEGIDNIYFTHEIINDKDEWFIETDGCNFRKLLGHPLVDMGRLQSNNVWDIYDNFGIEAARQFLIDEFESIMEGINVCHIKLLVEKMTFNGTISSISRYTMKRDASGPLSKASFEESLDHLVRSGFAGDTEKTRGVSASIICGKRSSIGTGFFDIKLDLEKLDTIKRQLIKNEVVENK